jgi:hypothetical protein
VAILAALALLAGTLLLRRRRRERSLPSAPKPSGDAPAPSTARARAVATTATERAVGYATGRHPRDLRHQAEAIERACSDRGWALTQVVRERRANGGHRPGLRFALEQLAEGGGTRLVACRLDDIGRTRDELRLLLSWCARTGVELVALDDGVDTSTRRGRLAARSLVTPGKLRRHGHLRLRPAFIRRRRAEAPVADGELAPSSSQ